MKKELIQALKENLARFENMDNGLQLAAKELGRVDFEYFDKYGKWVRFPNSTEFDVYARYRLRPDYEPEPKYEKYEIKPIENEICWETSVNSFPIDLAPRYANFSHFETDSGEVNVKLENIATLIRYRHKCYAVFQKG